MPTAPIPRLIGLGRGGGGLAGEQYKHCERVTLVCDDGNTHTKGAFYKVFKPARVRNWVRRLEFRYTPKHGNWLNFAESELSALTRQCMHGLRIGDLEEMRRKVAAWATDVNDRQQGVDWQMKVADARCKLKLMHPKLML